MTVSGGCKFFKKSKCYLADGASVAVDSGDASKDYMLSRNPLAHWRSLGSDDLTTETITITFPSATIDRLLLIDHNFKQYTVKYDVGSVWTNFASVVGINALAYVGGIAETVYAKSSSYYEFTPVTTTKIQILAVKTQIVDDQKRLKQAIVTEEHGTLQGFPTIDAATERQKIKKEMLSGRSFLDYTVDNFSAKINFASYPTYNVDDIDLIYELNLLDSPFHVYVCGGRDGTTYFKHQHRGFTIDDCPLVQIVNELAPRYSKGVYINPIDLSIQLAEAP